MTRRIPLVAKGKTPRSRGVFRIFVVIDSRAILGCATARRPAGRRAGLPPTAEAEPDHSSWERRPPARTAATTRLLPPGSAGVLPSTTAWRPPRNLELPCSPPGIAGLAADHCFRRPRSLIAWASLEGRPRRLSVQPSGLRQGPLGRGYRWLPALREGAALLTVWESTLWDGMKSLGAAPELRLGISRLRLAAQV